MTIGPRFEIHACDPVTGPDGWTRLMTRIYMVDDRAVPKETFEHLVEMDRLRRDQEADLELGRS